MSAKCIHIAANASKTSCSCCCFYSCCFPLCCATISVMPLSPSREAPQTCGFEPVPSSVPQGHLFGTGVAHDSNDVLSSLSFPKILTEILTCSKKFRKSYPRISAGIGHGFFVSHELQYSSWTDRVLQSGPNCPRSSQNMAEKW